MADDLALQGPQPHLANGSRGRSNLLPYQPHGFTDSKVTREVTFHRKKSHFESLLREGQKSLLSHCPGYFNHLGVRGGFRGGHGGSQLLGYDAPPLLEGPIKNRLIIEDFVCVLTPRHASVFSTHSDTQAAPAFHCIRMFKAIFSTRAFLKRTDTLSTIA